PDATVRPRRGDDAGAAIAVEHVDDRVDVVLLGRVREHRVRGGPDDRDVEVHARRVRRWNRDRWRDAAADREEAENGETTHGSRYMPEQASVHHDLNGFRLDTRIACQFRWQAF